MKFNKAKSKGLHLPRDSPRHQHGVGEELRAALQRTWGWRKSCTRANTEHWRHQTHPGLQQKRSGQGGVRGWMLPLVSEELERDHLLGLRPTQTCQ